MLAITSVSKQYVQLGCTFGRMFCACLEAWLQCQQSICLSVASVQVVAVLKKEVMKTQSKELEKASEYRQLLVQAIHSCAVKFPDVAGNVIHLLMGKLLHPNQSSRKSPHHERKELTVMHTCIHNVAFKMIPSIQFLLQTFWGTPILRAPWTSFSLCVKSWRQT